MPEDFEKIIRRRKPRKPVPGEEIYTYRGTERGSTRSVDIRLVLPVDGPITQLFGENPEMYARWGYQGHNGVDFGVPNSTPVKASAEGIVGKIAFENGGYGNYVRLDHADGYFLTYYAHLKEAQVSVGARVSTGQIIATSDNTGASTGPHLHWGLSIPSLPNSGFKTYHDPMKYLSLAPGPFPSVEIPSFAVKDLKLRVTIDELNVRAGPGVEYPMIKKLHRDQVIEGELVASTGAVWVKYSEGWCAALFNGDIYLEAE